MAKRIPTKYSFRYSKTALATLVLLLLLIEVIPRSTPHFLVSYGKTLLASIFLISLLVFLSLEIINFKDAGRFVDNHYRYDRKGIYREKILIIPWSKVAGVVFDYEIFIDKIPPHKDVAWAPWLNGVRDFETPELTRKARSSRIQILTKESGSKHGLTIETTVFRPLLWYLYRDMKGEAEKEGLAVPFDKIRSGSRKEKPDSDAPAT